MTIADLFRRMFGVYAEEFWSMPLSKMSAWLVADAPTAEQEYEVDAVEVVRCKDCINNDHGLCYVHEFILSDFGYCNFARRGSDNE